MSDFDQSGVAGSSTEAALIAAPTTGMQDVDAAIDRVKATEAQSMSDAADSLDGVLETLETILSASAEAARSAA